MMDIYSCFFALCSACATSEWKGSIDPPTRDTSEPVDELPLEEHGYRAREPIGHMLWEQFRWADTYVKNPVESSPQ
jgi:hypothetical protein